jgi:ankyrin repeat protein
LLLPALLRSPHIAPKLLLEAGVPVNAVDNTFGMPALEYAVKGDLAKYIVPLFLEHGVDPNTGNCSALHHTAKDPRLCTTMCALLHHGARTAAPLQHNMNDDDETRLLPLDFACDAGNLDGIFELFRRMVGQGSISFSV